MEIWTNFLEVNFINLYITWYNKPQMRHLPQTSSYHQTSPHSRISVQPLCLSPACPGTVTWCAPSPEHHCPLAFAGSRLQSPPYDWCRTVYSEHHELKSRLKNIKNPHRIVCLIYKILKSTNQPFGQNMRFLCSIHTQVIQSANILTDFLTNLLFIKNHSSGLRHSIIILPVAFKGGHLSHISLEIFYTNCSIIYSICVSSRKVSTYI